MTDSVDGSLARNIGQAVGSHDHDELSSSRIEEVIDVLETVETHRDSGDIEAAAKGLIAFWEGHRYGELPSKPKVDDPAILFEEAFQSGELGVDLYQALRKTIEALEGNEPFDLAGWTDRLLELTNRHVAHLRAHQHGQS
ncbi:MAG: hypothetical protein ACOCY6_04980 [Halodesulfurarchaeum sp.]